VGHSLAHRRGTSCDVDRQLGCAYLGFAPLRDPRYVNHNWWVALVSFGDGWHNNHHAYPVSARHGLKWYEFDFNWYTI
jgi:fatty-acid desaturase